MARPANFTEGEDAIILAMAGRPIEEVNAQLVNAGYAERQANEVRQRRYRLQNKLREEQPEDADEMQLAIHFARLSEQERSLERQLAVVRQEKDAVRHRLLMPDAYH